MYIKKYIFKKTHEIDREAFAKLLVAAKGGRTMKDFAEECGVNPSTFTRIIQMTNKGASSTELIEAIAKNADKSSGITIEALARANGYTVEEDWGASSRNISHIKINEALVRNILVEELVSRGAMVSLGNIRYDVSKTLSLRPDALFMTNAFGIENAIWFVEVIQSAYHKTMVDGRTTSNAYTIKSIAFDKISRFSFISMNTSSFLKPTFFSLVVCNREAFDVIVEEFSEMITPANISIIYIDLLNNVVADEYVLKNNESNGIQFSYFMSTPPLAHEENEYLADGIYEDTEEGE